MRRKAGQVFAAALATVLASASTQAGAQARAQASARSAPPRTPSTLDLYFIDVEGGQATLMITPSRETFLFDAGFPGTGSFNSKPGDPALARDPQRILAAAKDAGIRQIDHLVISHFHGDHFGGVMELAALLPIKEYIDHAPPTAAADSAVPGTQALFDAYAALRAKARHRQPAAGSRLAFRDVSMDVLATDGHLTTKPLAGAGQSNAACTTGGVPAQEKLENPLSTAVLISFGTFRFFNPGDLTGPPLYGLVCPTNLIGPVSVYLVAHHGGADGSDPSMFAALKPRVAILGNGPRKGAQAPTLAAIAAAGGIDGWQMHRTTYNNAVNLPDGRIANPDTTTSAWIKLSAKRDGSFTVTNSRTGETVAYRR